MSSADKIVLKSQRTFQTTNINSNVFSSLYAEKVKRLKKIKTALAVETFNVLWFFAEVVNAATSQNYVYFNSLGIRYVKY